MNQIKKAVTSSPRRVSINAESRVTSALLLNHEGKLWIEHAGERYLLRRTSNNRLILTK
ncbi:MAG: hemin uptake protein HemP [Alcanivorax sediminis]|uniref:Hemin uptake protein HemP n=1 Tax=Alcanivorax sediminis TaxID=2663008 RepID=A0A6N7LR98_9GAMM|nr:hemin uptake protein HemP [Alcanivorax sediminis]MQX52662.1 hemin uptake protein HemP [Alcanivorax sediminis]